MDNETEFYYQDEILDLIDNADDLTRSDLQGVVSAIVKRIVKEVESN